MHLVIDEAEGIRSRQSEVELLIIEATRKKMAELEDTNTNFFFCLAPIYKVIAIRRRGGVRLSRKRERHTHIE